jgi:hypothetical protein
MSEEDVRYGWKVLDALKHLKKARTFRLLSREPGLDFSSIVDAWSEWSDGDRAVDEPRAARVGRFLARFCEQHQIPDAFYQGCAAIEFAEAAAS